MTSSQEIDEEVTMGLIEQHEVRNDNQRNQMDDMMTFLLGNGYPQGSDRTKMRQYRLQSIPYAIVDDIFLGGILMEPY